MYFLKVCEQSPMILSRPFRLGTEQERKRAIELNNGRAAQMGILALMVHEKLDGDPYIINTLIGSPVDFN